MKTCCVHIWVESMYVLPQLRGRNLWITEGNGEISDGGRELINISKLLGTYSLLEALMILFVCFVL